MVGYLGKRAHKTMHYADTDEGMVRLFDAIALMRRVGLTILCCKIPVFHEDTNGAPAKSPHVMGRRNWTSVGYDTSNGELVFDIRVEVEKGMGNTIG